MDGLRAPDGGERKASVSLGEWLVAVAMMQLDPDLVGLDWLLDEIVGARLSKFRHVGTMPRGGTICDIGGASIALA